MPRLIIGLYERPTKIEMLMMMAHVAATRSACARRSGVGCLIVTPDLTNVIAIGYNGPARGIDEPCTPTPNVAGSCTCVHAEANALVKSDYVPSILITTIAPCPACARLILNSRVEEVYYSRTYRTTEGLDMLAKAGILVTPAHVPSATEESVT